MSLPRYAEYRETGIEWVPAAPASWTIERFSLHTRSHRDSVTPQQLDGEIVFHYSIPSIQEIGTGSEENGNSIDSNKLLIKEPQLLVSKLNPHKQVVIFVEPKQGLQTVASSEFIPLVPTRSHPDYIKYVWQSQVCKNYLLARCDSATRSHQRVSPEDITKMCWAWPSTDEQSAIAAVLDRETARIDALIAEQETLLALLAEKRQATISHAVTRGLDPNVPMRDSGIAWLGEVPAHWRVDRFKASIAFAKNGVWGAEPCGDEADMPCVRVADFDRRALAVRGDIPTIRNVAESERVGRVLQRGDLLLEKSGGGENQPVGQVVLYDREEPAVCSNFVARVRLREGMDSRFWRYLHAAAYAVRINTRAVKQTSGIQNLDQDQYFSESAVFPPHSEQCAISDFLDQAAAGFDLLDGEVTCAISLLKERRSALISAAVTGQIDVRGLFDRDAA